MIQVKHNLGKEEVVEAQIDWVEANFKPEVLSTVQSGAYQKVARVETEDPANITIVEK